MGDDWAIGLRQTTAGQVRRAKSKALWSGAQRIAAFIIVKIVLTMDKAMATGFHSGGEPLGNLSYLQ